jgi:hypothetical protein
MKPDKPDPGEKRDVEELQDRDMDGGQRFLLSSRQKAVIAASSYLIVCCSIFGLMSPFLFESWGEMFSPSPNTTNWEGLPFHIAYLDKLVYPNGSADPRVTIPSDVAIIPGELYQESAPIVAKYDGVIAREVVLNYGKIKTPNELTIPGGDQYLKFTGVDTAYLEMFREISSSLGIVSCPWCDGDGCPECNGTGIWGRYPQQENEIMVPEQVMNKHNLSLVFDQTLQEWVGEELTTFYDLEGAQKTGEYTLYVGPGHVPPREGVDTTIVGVTRANNSFIMDIRTAWALKGFSQEQSVSFAYIRIPRPRDINRVLKDLSQHYNKYDIFVLTPYNETQTD